MEFIIFSSLCISFRTTFIGRCFTGKTYKFTQKRCSIREKGRPSLSAVENSVEGNGASGQGFVGLLYHFFFLLILLALFLFILAVYWRDSRAYDFESRLKKVLVERAEKLARADLKTPLSFGVFGRDGVDGVLSEVLAPKGPISFRLELRPAEPYLVGGSVASSLIRCRLMAGAGGDSRDLTFFRTVPRAQIREKRVEWQ